LAAITNKDNNNTQDIVYRVVTRMWLLQDKGSPS